MMIIHFMGQSKPKPRIGDRRWYKGREQVRVQEKCNGMSVMNNGKPVYTWIDLDTAPPWVKMLKGRWVGRQKPVTVECHE